MNATIQREKPQPAAAPQRQRPSPSGPPVRRGRPDREWVSTLGHADLACLLQVIESELLPRLLREYRPADHASLAAARR